MEETYHITDNIPGYKECFDRDYTFADAIIRGRMILEKNCDLDNNVYYLAKNMHTCSAYRII